ncbi:hypothetical protein T4B_14971 [Trichinella pseudospiralis]|uniref:Uncharacterized protein n=2 Tax=Trichinella pseudospiralis TaxID=6337 RepID=A0A0V1HHZ6_TRIPS|nr:hypothetical protein T4B_14971 [Trichinella pseudospiralis]
MTAEDIQTLVDEFTKHRRCLMALDKDPYAGSFPVSKVLMPVLKKKFPPALQREWKLQLTTAAEGRFWEREKRSKNQTALMESPCSKWNYVGRITSSAAALAASVTKGCPFFQDQHEAEVCERFFRADLARRRAMLRKQDACF